jgi:hypothetical protein
MDRLPESADVLSLSHAHPDQHMFAQSFISNQEPALSVVSAGLALAIWL